MESIYYNLQNIIISLKKLHNTFKINNITNYHYDVVKLYIFNHYPNKLIDINKHIDYLLEDIGSLEITNKYYPKEYTNFILLEKLKKPHNYTLLIIHPMYNNNNIKNIKNVVYSQNIKIDGKIKYNNFLKQLYPKDGPLIEKTNKYYSENPLHLYILSHSDNSCKNSFISNDHTTILNISRVLLHSNSLDNIPDLSILMNDRLLDIKSDPDENCFFITNKTLSYININDEIESVEMPYYKRKNIIYNPNEHLYYNGNKFIRNNKTVNELIEFYNGIGSS